MQPAFDQALQATIGQHLSDIDNLNMPAIVLNADHSVQAINALAAQLHEGEQSVILGKDYADFCQTQQLANAFDEASTNKITPGNSITVTTQYDKDSQIRYVEWTISGLYTENQHNGFLLLGKEITQDKINKDNLKYLSKIAQDTIGQAISPRHTVKEYTDDIVFHLNNIIAQMPGSVYWKDKRGCYLGGNNTLVELSGMTSVKDFIGKHDTYLGKKLGWPDKLVNAWAEDDKRVSAGEIIINHEEPPFKTASGEIYHQLTNKVPLRNRDGNIVGTLGISVDITDRKRAEKLHREKLAAERTVANLKTIIKKFTGDAPSDQNDIQYYVEELDNYFQNIVRNLPGIVYWKDGNGVYLGCNQNTLNLIGAQSVDEIIGKTDYELAEKLGMAKHIAEKFIRDDQYVMETGKPLLNQEEPPFITADGSEIYELSNKTPLKNSAGKIIGILGVSVDITDRKRAEKLEQEKREQERLTAEKTINYLKIVATSIAHEIQNPLAGIRSSAEVAQIVVRKALTAYEKDIEANLIETSVSKTPPEKISTYLKKIVSKVNTANAYIAMQLANMRADRIDTSEFTSCSINRVIKEALEMYHFEDEAQRDLVHWQNNEDFSFYGSQRLTKHILLNLLSNALHYITETSKGEIIIWLGSDEQYNYLYFKDTAKGMPAEIAANVFNQFYSKRKNGTGLGLSLCQMVMVSYGGDISCVAEENQYAQFILKFPKEL